MHTSRQRHSTALSRLSPHHNRASPIVAAGCLAIAITLVIILDAQTSEAAAARTILERQTNQYFLNEFCDLQSKAIRNAIKMKNAQDTHLFLTSKNTMSSVRVLPQRQQVPSSISFGFGSSQPQPSGPIIKQLNCSIVVVAPKSHGLLLNVNSIGLPKNLTKLSITLNHDSNHSQQFQLEGETTSSQYLLTQDGSSKMAIHLQSFQPIDWSHVSFDILFTVYKKATNNTGCPNKKWFDCGDNICVPASLVCDNNRNCPNGNDEMMFYGCYSSLFLSIAASSALAIIMIVIVVIVVLIFKRRQGLNKVFSLSDNVLTADGDGLNVDNNSSKLDLTQESVNRSNSYIKQNLYYNGFENPVWTNGTLTKQHSKPTAGSSNQQTIPQSPLNEIRTVSANLTPQQSTSSDLDR